MKFDFETCPDRHGKDALAVDALGKLEGFSPKAPQPGFDAIPMWVADMNFKTAPSVVKAVAERLEHPLFGYFMPSDEYFDAIIRWQTARNGAEDLRPEHIRYENGVLGGFLSALSAITDKNTPVLLNSPTYIGFTHALNDAGFKAELSPLRRAGGRWELDFADMERRIYTHGIKAAVICSPHNPCGRVWTREELTRLVRIFEKYGVKIVSDEIWSDILLGGRRHTPTQTVSEYARENTVALYAPTKTFNLAGLVGSYSIIYGSELGKAVEREAAKSHYNSMNVLSMHALIGAYSAEGAEWLEELKTVLTGNTRFACDYINNSMRGVWAAEPEGTYMLFADCGEYLKTAGVTLDDVLERAWAVGAAIQDGRPFHGETSVRINLASPAKRIKEAFERLEKYVFI